VIGKSRDEFKNASQIPPANRYVGRLGNEHDSRL